jgi:hypothetical protein
MMNWVQKRDIKDVLISSAFFLLFGLLGLLLPGVVIGIGISAVL